MLIVAILLVTRTTVCFSQSAGSPIDAARATFVIAAGAPLVINDDGTWITYVPNSDVMGTWEQLKQSPGIVTFFGGMFRKMGVHIRDTGELLTAVHEGNRISFVGGIDEAAVDYTLQIYSFQADRIAAYVAEGSFPPIEQFRVARQLLYDGLTGRFGERRNPLSSNPLLRLRVRPKNVIHIYLASPDPSEEPDATVTMLNVQQNWIIAPGLHGVPERTWRLTVADTFSLNGAFVAAIRADRFSAWRQLARWYVGWREGVEVEPEAANIRTSG